jgi:hypothetical protein
MRKLTILLVLLSFVLGFFIVNIYGINLGSLIETVNTESVEITSTEGVFVDPTSEKRYIRIYFTEEVTYRLTWNVLPETATNKAVVFSINTKEDQAIVQKDWGIVTIFIPVLLFEVVVTTLDAKANSDIIYFRCYDRRPTTSSTSVATTPLLSSF